jgi:hypothetical protein
MQGENALGAGQKCEKNAQKFAQNMRNLENGSGRLPHIPFTHAQKKLKVIKIKILWSIILI